MHKTHHFAIKNPKIFWGGAQPPPRPHLQWGGDTPPVSPSPYPTPSAPLVPHLSTPSIENFWLRHCSAVSYTHLTLPTNREV